MYKIHRVLIKYYILNKVEECELAYLVLLSKLFSFINEIVRWSHGSSLGMRMECADGVNFKVTTF